MQFEAFVPALMEHDAAPLIFAAHNGDRHASSPQLEHSSTPVSSSPFVFDVGMGPRVSAAYTGSFCKP
jgi:hypothetical protein